MPQSQYGPTNPASAGLRLPVAISSCQAPPGAQYAMSVRPSALKSASSDSVLPSNECCGTSALPFEASTCQRLVQVAQLGVAPQALCCVSTSRSMRPSPLTSPLRTTERNRCVVSMNGAAGSRVPAGRDQRTASAA